MDAVSDYVLGWVTDFFPLNMSSLVTSILKSPKLNPGHLQLFEKERTVFLARTFGTVIRARN